MKDMTRVGGRDTSRDLARRHRLSEAQGMVSVQTHCDFGDALLMMRERARVNGQTVEEVADAVLDHRLSFSTAG